MLAGALAYAPMPGVIAIAGFLAAAVAGVAVGYYMATHQHLTIDEKTGHVSSRTSVIGTLLVLGLFAIRFGAKIAFPELAHPGHSAMTQAANGLLVFTVAVLITQTVSIWRRTQPMVAAHAARRLSGEGQLGPEVPLSAQPDVQSVAQPVSQATE
jgi:NhaP-type Na+/H+ or K+/H+ antiporter